MPDSTRTDWPDGRLDALERQVETLMPLTAVIAGLSANVAALAHQVEDTNVSLREDLAVLTTELRELRPNPRERREARFVTIAAVVGGLVTGLLTAAAAGLFPH